MNTWLDSLTESRRNNLNAIRLLLASSVILAHCFPLTLGREGDPLFQFSRGQSTFGSFAVDLFFFISGFLITGSWLNSKSMNDYLRRRVLRIVPGFVLAVIFSFVVASGFSLHPFSDLASRLAKFKCVFTLGNSCIEGPWVFPKNPYPFTANGSLWTISREFTCYLLIAAIGLFGFFKHRVSILAGFTAFYAYYCVSLLKGVDVSHSDRRFYTYFLAGTVVWLWRDKIPLNHIAGLAALCFTLLFASISPLFLILMPLTGSYLVLWAGYGFHWKSMAWCEKTDLSYGVYLFAFPVQQAIAHLGILQPWFMFAIATPITVGIAFLSWHLVEKPFLKLKSRNTSDFDPALQRPKIRAPEVAPVNW